MEIEEFPLTFEAVPIAMEEKSPPVSPLDDAPFPIAIDPAPDALAASPDPGTICQAFSSNACTPWLKKNNNTPNAVNFKLDDNRSFFSDGFTKQSSPNFFLRTSHFTPNSEISTQESNSKL
ncbi:hypothetical protein [Burkholderia lata]|uniref:hypothetical protein n=1 Tax=Burkholderia lata (strain ATCC 17760 / DSM 23089 / LMG 22485 / NCIMB 9086 / R18194 / 383) TaxID=482957 RepID=UPI001581A338|nr:hypothetical protein [Burkholderia lata]